MQPSKPPLQTGAASRHSNRPEVLMRKHLVVSLIVALGLAAVAGLLVAAYSGVPGLLAREKPSAAARPPAADIAHPLDPLTDEEMALAVKLLADAGKLPDPPLLPVLVLNEPPKDEVLRYRPGAPFRREAFAVVLDRPHNRTYEAILDLRAKQVRSWKARPDVQPALMPGEFEEAANLVRADGKWRAAMVRRGIRDFDKVYIEAWAPGPMHVPGAEHARLSRVISFYRGEATHPYGRPVEGVVALVNLTTGKVLEVQDAGVVNVPADAADFFDPAVLGAPRPALPALEVRQPRGPGFEVRGHEVRWDRWRFRYAVHPREGLVLYAAGYEDGGRVRPVLYRGSLSEMLVPYGDPTETWAWRSPFDEGEYGFGKLSVPLRRGHEVPDNAVLLDASLADDRGAAHPLPHAVALYEQDGGVLWSHTDLETGRAEARRGRQLVLTSTAVLGNYDYVLNWVFSQDGTLEMRVDLSGILLVRAVESKECPVCRERPGPDGKLRPSGEDRYGTFVAPRVVAANHQHFFCFRLDLDVDGTANQVRELDVMPVPPGKENPHGNGFTVEQTPLLSEKEAGRDLSTAASRTWRILNPGRRTALGHFPAYVLEPAPGAATYLAPDSSLLKRAGFLRHPVWVTRYHEDEQYPAGPYPNQSVGGDGLPAWVADGEPLDGQDVVLWHTVGVTHTPRPEEWPVMPAAHAGFRLEPDGFFTRNPALDLPR
jgi:primary-amine oxidase